MLKRCKPVVSPLTMGPYVDWPRFIHGLLPTSKINVPTLIHIMINKIRNKSGRTTGNFLEKSKHTSPKHEDHCAKVWGRLDTNSGRNSPRHRIIKSVRDPYKTQYIWTKRSKHNHDNYIWQNETGISSILPLKLRKHAHKPLNLNVIHHNFTGVD